VVLLLFPPLLGLKAAADVPMQYIQSYGFLFGVVLSEVQTGNVTSHDVCVLNFGAGIIFLTLAHPVYKM